jgi:outer membrane protein
MASNRFKILVAFLALFLAAGGVSAKVLTLDDCIQMALKNSADLIRAKGQVKVANGLVWQAFGAFLPGVSAGASVNQINSEPGVRVINDQVYQSSGITKNYNLGISAGVTLFNGGQNVFNYLGAKTDKSYYEYAAEQTEQSLILTVKTTYFAYLAAIKLEQASEEAVKRSEEQLKLSTSKYEIGSASKSDVLKAQVQYGKDKLSLLDAGNGIKTARADLAYLIGIDVNSDVDFSQEFNRKDYSGTEEEALKFGLGHYPGLLAGEKNLQAAKYDLRSTKGQFSPSVSFSISRSWSNEYWKDVSKFRSEDARWSFGTSLNIPIFENFSRKAALSRSKANLSNAKADYSYMLNNVALQIKKAYLEINKANEALKVAEENEAAATEDMSLVREKYSLGAATMLEVLDAEVSLITAQNSKIQSEFDFNLAVAKLENAMGMRE